MHAYLAFTNNTVSPLHLDKYTSSIDGKFHNDIFEIKDEKGTTLGYTGPMIRRTFAPEDFVMLQPGERTESALILNHAYPLARGKKYFVKYYAFNPALFDESPLMEMASNTVEILFK